MDRYDGKPFLRLIECYVLESIGMLNDRQRQVLQLMEPKLSTTFGVEGTWWDMVVEQMHFPASLPGDIRGMWDKYQIAAHEQHVTPDPEEFAIMFIDHNFPDIVSD